MSTRFAVLLVTLATLSKHAAAGTPTNTSTAPPPRNETQDRICQIGFGLNVTNTTNKAIAQRRLIAEMMQAPQLPSFTLKGMQFLEEILYHANTTDSPALLGTLFDFIIFLAHYTQNALEGGTFCASAADINATVQWYESGSPESLAQSLLGVGNNSREICEDMSRFSLLTMGCKDIPNYATMARCYLNGHVYEFEKVLAIYGTSLPCSLITKLRCLYYSQEYTDKFLAVISTQAIVSSNRFGPGNPTQQMYEILHLWIHSGVSPCCCELREKSWEDLCSYAQEFQEYTEYVVSSVLYAPECPGFR